MQRNFINRKVLSFRTLCSTLMCCLVLFGFVGVEAQDVVRIRTRGFTGNLPDMRGQLLPNFVIKNGIDDWTQYVCSGNMVNIPFEVENVNNGRLLSTNVFRAELSDKNGNFPFAWNPNGSPAPMYIGSIPGRTSGTIYANIPSTVPFGTGYRVRVVADQPRIDTRVEVIANQTDSTRNSRIVIFRKPCVSAETKAIDCNASLTVRINPGCSFGRCDCPGTDPDIPLITQNYYDVALVDYPFAGAPIFDFNNFTYTFVNIPTGWYSIRVRDRFSCDSTIHFYHVNAPTKPISMITVNNITDNSAVINWMFRDTTLGSPLLTSAAQSFDLQYRVVDEVYPDTTTPPYPSPYTHANWTPVYNINAFAQLLSNLQNNTRYEVRVRAICRNAQGASFVSPWSASKFFDTRPIAYPQPSNCRAPGGIFVRYSNITNMQSGRLFFNPDINNQATCYIAEYGPVRDANGNPSAWGTSEYTTRIVMPNEVAGGISLILPQTFVQSVDDVNDARDREMRVRVRGNCSIRCASTQQNLSSWSQTVLFNLPSPRKALEGSTLFSVYPNPNKGSFNINITSEESNEVNIVVRDLMGKTVYSTTNNTSVGENTVSVDISNHPTGIYLVQMVQGSQVNTVKVMVE